MIGVFTGVLGYYLYETNPRAAISPDQRLHQLVRWKIAKLQGARPSGVKADDIGDIDWKQFVAEVDNSGHVINKQ